MLLSVHHTNNKLTRRSPLPAVANFIGFESSDQTITGDAGRSPPAMANLPSRFWVNKLNHRRLFYLAVQ